MATSRPSPRMIRAAPALSGAALLLVLAMLLAVSVGAFLLTPSEVLRGLIERGDPVTARIVHDLRLPRVMIAALVGANLAIAGALLQGITRNPLGDPHLLGFSAGAGLFAVIAIDVLPATPTAIVTPAAFVGSLVSAAVVYALAWRSGITPVRFALAGVAVAALFTALSTAVLATSDRFTQSVLAFLAGGLYGSGWDEVQHIWPYTLIAGAGAIVMADNLNVLALGDDVARSLGMRVERVRLGLVVVAALLTGSAVAVAGLLAFIGLMVPHVARLAVGGDYRAVVPLSALLGALLLVLADTLARVVIAPVEIPVGIVTAVLGAPALLLLIRTRT
ncbi:MAG: iron ABC transporter permease [Dehalococcoidia bacterium]